MSVGSIAELRAALAVGAVSAVEVAADRLAAVAAQSGTVVAWDEAAVLRAAASVDERRRRGEPLGALAGVPLTVKDSFDVAGLDGSVGTAESVHRSVADAPAVAALRAADAVILGKTAVPPFLDSFDTAGALHGRAVNPWGAQLTAGGSSGGSAAAVASGLSWGDLGSDLTGSIRVPAAWNGVCGHRPSSGVISKRGHLPWPVGTRLEPSASAAGPIARSADDTAALFAVLAGSVSSGPWRLALPEPRFSRLSELTVGLWLAEESAPVDDETAAALAGLAERLRAAGATVVDLGPSVLGTAEAEALFDRLVLHEISYPGGPGAPVAQVWADWDEQLRLRAEWERAIAGVDVVLAPVVPFAAPAFPLAEADRRAIGRWSCLANLAMGPSTVLPIGLGATSGLPLAAQLIGAHGDDLATLGAARLLAAEGLAPPTLRAPETA
ncbi:amidase [Rathayibacter sp. VKM Ac-2926]|uniref:amidase n=1 Tax=Rathayibacter sp. VKM Ac-2926 TaxID=2929477 RepID=UPI001FB4DF90|nr:amidase family protein [Rathayibacter sp. VKM Ac-2926]MCJ1703187.1 amidase family protein [Rathayibacter sp. VKM Ac-2926]